MKRLPVLDQIKCMFDHNSMVFAIWLIVHTFVKSTCHRAFSAQQVCYRHIEDEHEEV